MVEREGWRRCNGDTENKHHICYNPKNTEITLKISGDKEIILLKEDNDLKQVLSKSNAGITATAFLFEWENYYVEIHPDDKNARVFVGDEEISRSKGLEKQYPLQFQNQLGKVVIRVRIGEREIDLPEIEVISRKLWPKKPKEDVIDKESPLFYPTFYQNLVDSLKEHCLSLSFDILAPTYLRAEEALRPPSNLFKFHYFKRNWKEIMEAYNTIIYQPYKRLVERDNFVRISQVKAIDGSVIHDIITHPERWEEVKTQSSFPLAKKLGNRLPTIVLQREKYETYDVPENRFAKFFLQTLLNDLDDIMRAYEDQLKKNEFKEVKENFETLRDFLMSIQMMDVFVEAGEMRIFPANSTVLQKRDGYRELLKLYWEFRLSYCPLFKKIEEAFAARDIATLYEYWCFFEIGKVLGEVLSENKKEPTLVWDITGGLEAEKSYFEFENGDYTYKLMYNKEFRRDKKDFFSYSVPLRPDFSLVRERKDKNGRKESATIVFDAKFRFDEKYVEGKLEGDEAIDDESENEMRRGNFERVANLDDILKMHTYKDALKLKAAFVVFPGNTACLFQMDGKRYKNEIDSDNKIKDLPSDFEGVGYIPLVPGEEAEVLKTVIINLLNNHNKQINKGSEGQNEVNGKA